MRLVRPIGRGFVDAPPRALGQQPATGKALRDTDPGQTIYDPTRTLKYRTARAVRRVQLVTLARERLRPVDTPPAPALRPIWSSAASALLDGLRGARKARPARIVDFEIAGRDVVGSRQEERGFELHRAGVEQRSRQAVLSARRGRWDACDRSGGCAGAWAPCNWGQVGSARAGQRASRTREVHRDGSRAIESISIRSE
jgi:hypothetical protein